MYKNELKTAVLSSIYDSTKNIDNELINIKIAIHNLENLGIKTNELEKLLDNIGIEYYKFKKYFDFDMIK